MNIVLQQGKYVVAVSGGVDSVVLLHLLNKHKDLELIVAHFDHGIRSESADDKKFVEELAKKYGLIFEYKEGKLGKDASEEIARKARYKFLHQVKEKYHAEAIVTAHHQDDVIETMCINILRGTNRKGLTSLKNTADIRRPLLHVPKKDIISYAREHHLQWQEDSTNTNETYLRNWVRNKVIKKLSEEQRQELIKVYESTAALNTSLESILEQLVPQSTLDKRILSSLDHKASTELTAHWLRKNNLREFDSKTLERIVVEAKTRAIGKKIPVYSNKYVLIEKDKLSII